MTPAPPEANEPFAADPLDSALAPSTEGSQASPAARTRQSGPYPVPCIYAKMTRCEP